MNTPLTKPIPKPVWDALEKKAAEVGGVGSGRLWLGDYEAPCCLYGIAEAVDGVRTDYDFSALGGACVLALLDADIGTGHVDSAVERLVPEDASMDARVPFADVMRELGLTRAES